jgi:hypothetical protein
MPGLPGAGRAAIDRRKITHYLLASDHPAERAKAAFFNRFGFRAAEWRRLRDALLDHAHTASVAQAFETQFGRKYVMEGRIVTPDGRKPNVRSIWFVAEGETTPRLVTAYALRGVQR